MQTSRTLDCTRCGKCCSSLITEDNGVTRGLTLLPEEATLFPDECTAPAIGIGSNPASTSFNIIAYQLKTDQCPHHTGDSCTIYPDRPASCRQFPFSLEPGDPDPMLGVDLNCPAVQPLLDSGDSLSLDMDAAKRLLELKQLVKKSKGRVWFYDLAREGWLRG